MAALPALALAQPSDRIDESKPVTRTEVGAKLDSDYRDLDGDKDGKVTAAEINARIMKSAAAQIEAAKKDRDGAFAKMDANSDGSVSKVEWEAGVKLPTAKEPDPKPFLARFDANKDGTISKDEFRAPTLANFGRLDANKDGTVTPAEIKSAAAAPAARKKAAVRETPPIGR